MTTTDTTPTTPTAGDRPSASPPPGIPADDPSRVLTVANADTDANLLHLAVVGDTYTVLVGGRQTAGRYALLDMLVRPGGGPRLHRHDFEEMFHIITGELSVTLRGQVTTATAGTTVNVPANAPHAFRNDSTGDVRMLCMVSPAGLEEYFADFAEEVSGRTTPGAAPSDPSVGERMARSAAIAPRYRIEVL